MADFPLSAYTFSEDATDTAASRGVSLTLGGSGTKSGWTELIASTDKETSLIILSFDGTGGTSDIKNVNLDIGIGGAGSEEIIIEDIFTQLKVNASTSMKYYLPVQIAQGTRVAVRGANNGAAVITVYVSCHLFSSTFKGNPPYSKTTSYGISGTDGTSVDPGGTANTKGSWVEITSSTSDLIKAFNVCIGGNTNNAHSNASFLYDVGIGGSGSEEIILENMPITSHSSETSKTPVYIQQEIPSGTRLAIRMQSSITDATDRILSFTINGIS